METQAESTTSRGDEQAAPANDKTDANTPAASSEKAVPSDDAIAGKAADTCSATAAATAESAETAKAPPVDGVEPPEKRRRMDGDEGSAEKVASPGKEEPDKKRVGMSEVNVDDDSEIDVDDVAIGDDADREAEPEAPKKEDPIEESVGCSLVAASKDASEDRNEAPAKDDSREGPGECRLVPFKDPNGSSATSSLRYEKRRMDDKGVADVAKELEDRDLRSTKEIDFSKNAVTTTGFHEIANICRRCPDLKVLKLFGNEIDDEAAKDFEVVFHHCRDIQEIHLSHNRFSGKGVEAIVKAAERELSAKSERPLWLRFEHNRVDNAEEFAKDLQGRFDSVCVLEQRTKCTARYCISGRRIHLPFLIDRDRRKPQGGDNDWHSTSWKGYGEDKRNNDKGYDGGYKDKRYGGSYGDKSYNDKSYGDKSYGGKRSDAWKDGGESDWKKGGDWSSTSTWAGSGGRNDRNDRNARSGNDRSWGGGDDQRARKGDHDDRHAFAPRAADRPTNREQNQRQRSPRRSPGFSPVATSGRSRSRGGRPTRQAGAQREPESKQYRDTPRNRGSDRSVAPPPRKRPDDRNSRRETSVELGARRGGPDGANRRQADLERDGRRGGMERPPRAQEVDRGGARREASIREPPPDPRHLAQPTQPPPDPRHRGSNRPRDFQLAARRPAAQEVQQDDYSYTYESVEPVRTGRPDLVRAGGGAPERGGAYAPPSYQRNRGQGGTGAPRDDAAPRRRAACHSEDVRRREPELAKHPAAMRSPLPRRRKAQPSAP